jgi:hypothetical protein
MESDDLRKRVQAEKSLRSQRDAAERGIPGERLRREIREAFERKDARDRADDPTAGRPSDQIRGSDS